MSLETNAISNVGESTGVKITNVFQETMNKQDGCNTGGHTNNFGNYFQTCSSPQAYWGSLKPAPDVCTPELQGHEGVPCHSLWNNSTKRKSVVDYKR